MQVKTLVAEVMDINELKPHPRNYRTHPADQLAHVEHSIRTNGFYRNVVVARDGTILAGHGVVLAAKKLGIDTVPVVRLDMDPDDPRALKVIAGDNEIAKLAEVDDRALTEMLKEIAAKDIDKLLGTGFDEKMLASLVMVTRPASEIADINDAAEWVGMPEYDPVGEVKLRLVITFTNEVDRTAFVEKAGLTIDKMESHGMWSTRWPFTEREDASSVRFSAGNEGS